MDETTNKTDEIEEELLYREFRDALTKINVPKSGEIVKVPIVGVNNDGVLVNLETKSEGFIPRSDFGARGIPKEFAVGMEIPVIVGKVDGSSGVIEVSYNLAKQKVVWEDLKGIFEKNGSIKGKVLKKIKGGFILDIGIDAFLPLSHVDNRIIRNMDKMMGMEIDVMIIKLEDKTGDVVVSHKKFTEIERQVSRDKIYSQVKVDDIVEGKVSSIADFGAFVDIGGGVEGLAHINDLSWHRIDKVSDVVKVGDTLKLKIIKLDTKENRISLSLKHLMPHPWDGIEEKYSAGKIVKGKVVHITNFGAFVELEKGIEGLLHVSEMGWNKRNINPKDIVKVNQELDLMIIDVDKENEKLSLSLKRVLSNPWQEMKTKYPKGTKIQCKVVSVAPFGVFVDIGDGFEGLIHLNDLSWTKKIKSPGELVKPGKEIEAVVLEISPEQEKATLSIKHLTENPFEKYGAGKIVNGKVKRILNFGAFVELEKGIEAFMHISEITNEKNRQPSEFINLGQEIEVKVIKSDPVERKIEVSMKKLEMDREKELIKKYSKVENQRLGDLLEEKE